MILPFGWPHPGPAPRWNAPLSCACLVFGLGCAPATPIVPPKGQVSEASQGAEQLAEITEAEALRQRAATAFAQRHQPGQLHAAVRDWTRAAELESDEPETLLQLSRALHLQALQQLAGAANEPGQRDLASASFRSGFETALLALAASGALGKEGKAVPALGEWDQWLAGLSDTAVRALYWRGLNLLRWSHLQSYGERLIHVAEVRRSMEHCASRIPSHDQAGPHRVLGSLNASPPSPTLRDLPLSLQHFQAAQRISPHSLASRVALARDYAVAAQDRAIFEREIRSVLEAPPGGGSEQRIENRLAQQEAARLAKAAGSLFE